MDQELIVSTQNPRIKDVTRLHQKKHREESGLILIEGRHPVEEAIAAGLTIDAVYLLEYTPLPAGLHISPTRVSEAVMTKMSTTDSPPPILAVASRCQEAPPAPWSEGDTLALAMVELQDPGNVGTLMRSACAFGVKHILLVGEACADPYSPKVIRASAGLVFRLTLTSLPFPEALTGWLANHPDVQVWGADAHRGTPYLEVELAPKNLLLMGSEAHGIPESLWKTASPLHIPLAPGVESLNVGVAGAILLAAFYKEAAVN